MPITPMPLRKFLPPSSRPADHPLIVHIGADDLLFADYASDIPDVAWSFGGRNFWPGPLTLILKKASGVPDVVTGGQDTVGIRVPGHPVALTLLRAFTQSRQNAGQQGGGWPPLLPIGLAGLVRRRLGMWLMSLRMACH